MNKAYFKTKAFKRDLIILVFLIILLIALNGGKLPWFG